MRTTVSIAARPRDLPWQGPFTTETYAAQTPVVWQHLFVSHKQMTNWFGGSNLFLAWVVGKKLTRKTNKRRAPQRTTLHRSFRIRHSNKIYVGAHVGKSSPPA
jgi:hypothetical protein